MAFLVSAILLSLERITYVWVWRRPESFRRLCELRLNGLIGDPVLALRRVFYFFKVLQAAVFVGWCYHYGHGANLLEGQNIVPVVVGTMLAIAGQSLNMGVFYRLGLVGVFYGNQFGHEVPWCSEFPFSLLDHPQYVGALISIWGFFIAMRFPNPDWYLLPALETVYYCLGAWFEQ